ncbi:hypothetical protein COHCIP112018_02352 [Cohnella sp. JJ-181]|nr:hypothetical protein COHCIP112018_02352 [Cohnella sp. JJ-181]
MSVANMNQSAVINHAFVHSIPIAIWYGEELMGMGLVKQHTKYTVVLSDNQHYYKHIFTFKLLKQPALR